MILYFVRHGQTDFNKKKIPQGQEIDVSLNEEGVRQVEEATRYLPNNIDFIISSPLKRTLETAQILNKKVNTDIELNDDVKEYRYGSLAGKSWTEIAEILHDPEAYQHDQDLLFDYHAFGGDSADDLKQRVKKFITGIQTKYKNKTILITTHGGFIDAMHQLFPQKEKKETDNATIHQFIF